MRKIVWQPVWICAIGALILADGSRGQDFPVPSPARTTIAPSAPAATMKQLMVDLVHPASNDILYAISRPPKDEREWASVRHSALVLAEAGRVIIDVRERGSWQSYVNMLANAARTAYKAALAKDGAALAEVGPSLDASCTACHKEYRPDVFPKEGASK